MCKKRAHRPEGALPRKRPQRGFHGLPGGPAGGLVAVPWVRFGGGSDDLPEKKALDLRDDISFN